MFLISPYSHLPGTMLSAIQRLGLTSGLQMCLDASDVESYGGSGQKWLDVSGNGYDFFRGTGAGSEASDPTFNGVAGGQSSAEYWGFDGGDFFTYDTTTETWMQNIHKNNAKFAVAAWVYIASTGVQQPIFGNAINVDSIGFAAYINSAGLWKLAVERAGDPEAYVNGNTVAVPTGQWSFLSIVFDEAAGTSAFRTNATEETPSATYSSPSASSATHSTFIGKVVGIPDVFFLSGARLRSLSVWEGTIPSAAQMEELRQVTMK